MGDGLLAVFQSTNMSATRSRSARACSKPRANTAPASRRCNIHSATPSSAFRFGVALHVGRILYGNIGGGSRLDFTCIGPAINLAARLEKLTGKLHRTVVASEGFAGICQGGWNDLGEFPVAGFSKAARVFGLMDEDADADARPFAAVHLAG